MGRENVIMPEPDADTEAYWEGCRSGRLLIQKCRDCGVLRFPPRPVCEGCQSEASEWIEASGRGRLYSWVVMHHALLPELEGAVPYVVALIELEEGTLIVANLRNWQADDLRADLPLKAVFERASDEFVFPQFEVC